MAQDKYFGALDDCLESVGDCKDCATCKLLLDEGLDLLFGNDIDIGGCFVHDDNFVVSQNGSANAH